MSKAAERIAEEIRENGPITFARFMELALYCPNYGYYEKEEDSIGRRGDYYTSASATSLFGELLAFQFAEWLDHGQAARTRQGLSKEDLEAVRIVEAGAHGGKLAKDILTWMLRHRPTLFGRLQYWIVEPSDRRLAWQKRNLAEFGDKVRWARRLAQLRGPASPLGSRPRSAAVREVIFSNELLDAMPVHRVGWDAKAHVWFEWGVTLQDGRFAWTRLAAEEIAGERPYSVSASSIVCPQLPGGNEFLDVLPTGFSNELCLAAEQWWREAANLLEHGKLLAIDYGLTADEFFLPERKEGTLRAYHRHQPSSDVLANPGEQDITAQVNFTTIRGAGESAGLRTDAFLTQAQFLTSVAARAWRAKSTFGEWTPERTRQFQTLTHPEHLGRSFRVLVQSRR